MIISIISTYAHYATAFLYNDLSGFEDNDIKEFNDIMKQLQEDYPNMYSITLEDFEQEPYFTKYPDYGTLAGNCLDYCIIQEGGSND